MQKITPHLWFDTQAKEAAEFYVNTFGDNSNIKTTTQLHDTPSGDVDSVSFQVLGHHFMAISAGPLFKPNPSISFSITGATKEAVSNLWHRLADGGTPLMELGEYPFSPWYGWIQDKYGVSWQLIVAGGDGIPQNVTPALMFTHDVCGKVEEAMNFYTSVFQDSEVKDIFRYTEGQEPDKAGTVAHALFTLAGQEFIAMDSAQEHNFTFNEAISLMVYCDTQEEIDHYWEKLSVVPEAEQCGWLKDKYGVSWQIVPTVLDEMMSNGTKEQIESVTQEFLKMKKFDIVKLQEAYEGK